MISLHRETASEPNGTPDLGLKECRDFAPALLVSDLLLREYVRVCNPSTRDCNQYARVTIAVR